MKLWQLRCYLEFLPNIFDPFQKTVAVLDVWRRTLWQRCLPDFALIRPAREHDNSMRQYDRAMAPPRGHSPLSDGFGGGSNAQEIQAKEGSTTGHEARVMQA